MKSRNLYLSIAMRETPSFARPLSPGCPTDSVGTFTDTSLPWTVPTPHPRTTISREPSWNASTFTAGPAVPSAWRIEPGTYVAFSLDTDSIAARFPPDSAIHRTILSFPVGRYLGLVASSFAYRPDDEPGNGGLVEELVINYVSSSPPQIINLQAHTVPIHPSMDLNNNSLLKTTTLFPWQDMFQWTTLGTRLQISHLYESSLKFDLHEEDLTRFEENVAVDYVHMAALAARVAQPEGPPEEELLAALQIPMFSLPAKIWRDIREADHRADPMSFATEILQIQELCGGS